MEKKPVSRRLIAAALVKTAKSVLADGYRYDPDHKHKPSGGGWTKTEKGWSRRTPGGIGGGNGNSGAHPADYFTRRNTAFSERTPPETLKRLATDSDENIRTGVGSNAGTPPETLKRLATDQSQAVRCAVGSNPKTPSETLTVLAQERSADTRMSVARNPAAKPPLLAHLAGDADSGVRKQVAENPSAPSPVLRHLLRDSDNFVREAALTNYPPMLKVDFVKRPIRKKATRAESDGVIETREGPAAYKAGDYIAEDAQGGKYPIKADDFARLYTPTDKPGVYQSKPKRVTLFKTDTERTIHTEWGDYTASPGDWVELKPDNTLGAPRKPDVVFTDYRAE